MSDEMTPEEAEQFLSGPSLEEQIEDLPSKQVESLRRKIPDGTGYDDLTPEQFKTLRAYISFWMGSDNSRRFQTHVQSHLARLDEHVEFMGKVAQRCGIPAEDTEHANVQAAIRRNALERDKHMAVVFPDAIGPF